MARRTKGHRRGSRPWRAGVRTLTSADPARKRRQPAPESRACESCCQLFVPPAEHPNVPLCLRCYIEERQYQKSLKRRGRPDPPTPKGDPAGRNSGWLTLKQFRMVQEAVKRRV